MKKFFLMLLAVVGISVAAMADGTLTCTVYGSGGAKATLDAKGDCADDKGGIYIPVKIDYNGTAPKSIKVVVNVYDARTGCFVLSREFFVDSYEREYVKDLEPGKCYTFSLSNAITCE